MFDTIDKFYRNRLERGIRGTAPYLRRHLKRPIVPSGIQRMFRRIDEPTDLAARMIDLAEELKGVGAKYETPFLALGQELQGAFEDTEGLTRTTRQTMSCLGEQEEGSLLARVTVIADQAVRELDGGLARMSDTLTALTASAGHLGALRHYSAEIQKIALFLRVIGMNIGVECARSEEGRAMFGVVGKDVVALSAKIQETVTALRTDAENALAVQQTAREAVTERFAQIGQLAGHGRQAVQTAVADVRRLVDAAVRTMERAGRHSEAISQQVGRIVAAIQFHDNMSQRLAHVVTALQEAPCETASLPTVHAIVALQEAQIAQVMAEAREVHQQNASAFTAIDGQIDQLMKALAGFGAKAGQNQTTVDQESGRGACAFSGLLTALKHLAQLLERGAPLIAQVEAALTEAGRSAGRLSDHAGNVGRVSLSVHIIALNAIVKAAHLDARGLSLEVLAQEVSRLSDQAGGIVAAFQQAVAAIEDSVAVEAEDRGKVPEAPGDADHIHHDLRKGIAEVEAIAERFETDTHEAQKAADRLKTRLAEIQHSLAFFEDLDRTLRDARDRLATLRETLSRYAGDEASHRAETAKLAAHYTMDRERLVHSQTYRGGAAAAVSAAPAAGLTDVSDGGMDFFEDFAAEGEAVGAETPTEAPAHDASEKNDPSASTPAGNTDDLDGNIELF